MSQQKVSSIMATSMRSPKPYQQMQGLGWADRQIPPWVLRPGEKPFRKEDAPPPPPGTVTAPPGNIDLRPPPGAPQEQPPMGAGSQVALENERTDGASDGASDGAPPGEAGGPLAVPDGYRTPSPTVLQEATYLQLNDGRMVRDLGDVNFELIKPEDFAPQDRLDKEISDVTMKEIDVTDRSIKSIYTKR